MATPEQASRERAFRVYGRVQGVGFRWWTRSQARQLGLSGTVRNCPDGSVLIHAKGRDADVTRLERLLARGPEGALVERVAATDTSGIPDDPFIILR